MKAVFLDYLSLAPEDLDWSALHALSIEWVKYDYTRDEQAAERTQGMDIVLSNKVMISREVLEQNPQLKQVIALATGTNNVDLQAAAELGVPVSNIVSYSTESVVQHTFACLLQLENHIAQYRQTSVDGTWSSSKTFTVLDMTFQELAGKTLGVIGYGAIGKRVAEVAKAFGMQILIAESPLKTGPQVGRVPLQQLLAESDVVAVHAPLSPLTDNLIDSEQLNMMKPTAVLLNMGRGGIVNEAALFDALKNKTIRAAALDVLTQEPPPQDHVLIKEPLDNLLITPHIAWASQQARQELLRQVHAILIGLQEGVAVNQVTP